MELISVFHFGIDQRLDRHPFLTLSYRDARERYAAPVGDKHFLTPTSYNDARRENGPCKRSDIIKDGEKTMNVFRKRLRAEFGQKSYRHFVTMCREEMKENNPLDEIETDVKEVYREMCERIREWTPEEIAKKKERLAGTLLEAFRIARQFSFVFLFYIVANVVLIAMGLQPAVTNVSLALIGLCFLYKVYEFVCNRFCFVDAYLMMLYKTALERTSD